MRQIGKQASGGAVRNERIQIDAVRGGNLGIRISFQASNYRSCLCKSICIYGTELSETGKHNMVSDFPSGKRKLLKGFQSG